MLFPLPPFASGSAKTRKLIDLESACKLLIVRVWKLLLAGRVPLLRFCPERLRVFPSPFAVRVLMVWAIVVLFGSMIESEESLPSKIMLIPLPLVVAPLLLRVPTIVPSPPLTLMLIVPLLALLVRLLVSVPFPEKLIFAVPAEPFPAVR